MERSGKRGKIPQQDWPSIIARYEAGETLASIARTYDCSPPAISYILSRSRARATMAAALTAAPSPEQQSAAPPPLQDGAPSAEAGRSALSEPPGEAALKQGDNSAPPNRDRAAPEINPPASRIFAPPGGVAGNGIQNASPPREPGGPFGITRTPQEDSRRTLRLSQGQGNGQERNGNASPGHGLVPTDQIRGPAAHGAPAPRLAPAEPPRPQPVRPPAGPSYAQGNGAPLRTLAEPQTSPREGREGGAIDQALRERVHTDLTAFLAAFDAALAYDTPESRAGLREATDRLLRAGARTRIELERLEARLPLPVRDAIASGPAWRQR